MVHQKSVLFATIFFFLNEGFNFQPSGCSGCHDVIMMSININSIAILNIHGIDYRFIIAGTAKRRAVNFFKKQ